MSDDAINRPQYRTGGYVSEFEQFMGHYIEEHPQVLEEQHKGWQKFWDRNIDFEELKKEGKDTVPIKGYDYF